MKDLLKITLVDNNICEVNSDTRNDEDGMHLAAALLDTMCRNINVAWAIVAAARVFMEDTNNVREIAAKALFGMPINKKQAN